MRRSNEIILYRSLYHLQELLTRILNPFNKSADLPGGFLRDIATPIVYWKKVRSVSLVVQLVFVEMMEERNVRACFYQFLLLTVSF